MNDAQSDNVAIEPVSFARAEATRETVRWFRPLPMALTVAFALLAVAVYFMLSARAVRLDVAPVPDSLSITAGFSYALGERYLMLPGDYVLEATLEGHEPLRTPFTVGDAADQTLRFSLQRLPGILTVATGAVTDAEVLIDQERAGTTPLRLADIAPGLHDVSIRATRYLPYDTEIEIEGMRREQQLDVTLAPAWADYTLTSQPADAEIIVDGETVARTPATIEILEGQHTVELRKRGFKTWASELDVRAGEGLELPPVALMVADGSASIRSSPASANVTIDGEYRGQTPLDIVLAPGKVYAVTLSRAGFVSARRQLRVQPNADSLLTVPLAPVVGTIRLAVEPAGGTLYVDGEAVSGSPSRKLTLTASPHDIAIELEGYARYETTITPQPDLEQQLQIRLKTEEQAAAERVPQVVTSAIGQQLKLIIPGRLTMGAGRREPGRRSNEIERTVVLTRPFYLGVLEVTNDDYLKFDPSHDSGAIGRSLLNNKERPVVNLTWDAAARFCNWLSANEGLDPAYVNRAGKWFAAQPMTNGYRLPTEAEWAWTARYAGPQVTRFPWGDTMPPQELHANYADISAAGMVPYHIAGYNDSYRGPAPSGSFPANTLGIHDLAGNVAEWIHDVYTAEPVSEELIDYAGPAEGEFHVIRGSSFMHGRFSELRWTYRDYGLDPRPDVGFRIARFAE